MGWLMFGLLCLTGTTLLAACALILARTFGLSEDIEQLRAETEQLRAEIENLRSQLLG
jgi:cell division protein FtsB